jgi:putative exporter of polyketide antibiotics
VTAVPPSASAYPEQSQATTALVLSILGLLCCGILGVVGLVIANNEKQGIAAGRRDPANQGMAQAAFVIGIVAIALWVLGLIANFALGLSLFGSADF